MFTPQERARLREEVLQHAACDTRLSGGAITGSAAGAGEDEWSDIDLAFGVLNGTELMNVVADWTAYMYERYGVVDHYDMRAGSWFYRVFLLPNTLQVDLAFVAAPDFCAMTPTFRLVFGKANEARQFPAPKVADLIGLGWLYALHARSAIARRKFWQAEYMISGVRDNALAMACLRHELPAVHARGIDRLPEGIAAQFESALVRKLDAAELGRAFRSVVEGFLGEILSVDQALGRRLEGPLIEMTSGS
jgi:hypothetical protein